MIINYVRQGMAHNSDTLRSSREVAPPYVGRVMSAAYQIPSSRRDP